MKKLFISLLILSEFCLFSLNAHAQLSPNSLASQFAAQTGTIAGVVQSCGQSIVEYNSRVVEAVNVLAKSPQEQAQAMTVYQKALSDAQMAQTRTHSMNCGQAMESFNSLPLMRPDYKKTVLPQLAQMANPTSPPPTTPAAASATPVQQTVTATTSTTTTTGNK